jgi:CDP-diacylglycerol--glycerol-3-phosphate 3-phosphatidyltransferase
MIRMGQRFKNQDLKFFEYDKPDWTYHAKGIWVTEPGEANPSLNVIGSSNYSYRSNRRDTECNLYMTTQNPDVKEQWEGEWKNLVHNSTQLAKGKKINVEDYKKYGVEF